VLVVSRGDLDRLDLDPEELVDPLEEAFAAGYRGELVWTPKAMVSDGAGKYLMGAEALWPSRRIGVFHNLAGTPADAAMRDGAHYRSVQVLFDSATATPIAVLDGTMTSRLLPVAVTIATATRLANPGSSVLGIVGAGVQAWLHAQALSRRFPIKQIRIAGRTTGNVEALTARIRGLGIDAVGVRRPEDAIRGANLVVTTVPASASLTPFLDPAWVSPGAFLSAVDLARSWHAGLDRFELLMTDDPVQAKHQEAAGRLPRIGEYGAHLGELFAGATLGRRRDDARIALVHPGNAVGVLAVAMTIHAKALAQGVGTQVGLP